MSKAFVHIVAAGLLAITTTAPAADGQITAHLGARKTLMHDGQGGLRYFPDGAMAVLQTRPQYRVLLAAGVSSWLLEGHSLDALAPVKKVLAPGDKGTFDNGYAGIGGACEDAASGELLAFYHAEDQEGMGQIPGGIPGFYCSIALAVSKDSGTTFTKLGPVITSHAPKNLRGMHDQGCGEACVVADASGRWLFAYYTDHSRAGKRGVQICLARCAVADKGRPGSWRKFFDGAFVEPGLTGKDTPVMSATAMRADALFPHVSYSKPLRKYVMVFNIHVYREFAGSVPPKLSGIHVAFSDDGVSWSKPEQLIAIQSIAALDREVGWHPTLIWSDGASADGWLCYSYSERWGHNAGRTPHYLVGHPISFSVNR